MWQGAQVETPHVPGMPVSQVHELNFYNAAKILNGRASMIEVDDHGGYTHLASPKRFGGDPNQCSSAPAGR